MTIIDVTDKAHPYQISRTPYSGSGYTHQGWLTADQKTKVQSCLDSSGRRMGAGREF